MNQKKIDIIIPAWKAQETIVKTLASIVEQTIADQCIITIVNDADGIGYADIVEHYSKYLDIRELTLPENKGPGYARQYGLDHTVCEYISFCDADDTFYGPFSLEMLIFKANENPQASIISGEFWSSGHEPTLHFVYYKSNLVWTFAKLYRRAFLDQYNIRFPDSRANEDVGFNRLIELLAIEPETKPVNLEKVVYCWFDNPNSITRSTKDFTYSPNIIGYIDNMMYAINNARNRGANNNLHINHKIIDTMVAIYVFVIESINYAPQYREQNIKKALEFYDNHYQLLEFLLGTDFLKARAITKLKEYQGTLEEFIPEMTYTQFINHLKGMSNGDFK